jgi:hypothetical protein
MAIDTFFFPFLSKNSGPVPIIVKSRKQMVQDTKGERHGGRLVTHPHATTRDRANARYLRFETEAGPPRSQSSQNILARHRQDVKK